jgi:hypothetical protein
MKFVVGYPVTVTRGEISSTNGAKTGLLVGHSRSATGGPQFVAGHVAIRVGVRPHQAVTNPRIEFRGG